jgi:hypothetical protein
MLTRAEALVNAEHDRKTSEMKFRRSVKAVTLSAVDPQSYCSTPVELTRAKGVTNGRDFQFLSPAAVRRTGRHGDRALINSRPQCPRRDEIEAILKKVIWGDTDGPDVLEVRTVLARLAESRDAAGKLHDWGPEFDAANDKIDRWMAKLDELEAQIPNPPRSYVDLVILAEIARAGADVGGDGRMAELDDNDCFERPAARLIEAVLQFGQAVNS